MVISLTIFNIVINTFWKMLKVSRNNVSLDNQNLGKAIDVEKVEMMKWGYLEVGLSKKFASSQK